jgi:hypothetical protein
MLFWVAIIKHRRFHSIFFFIRYQIDFLSFINLFFGRFSSIKMIQKMFFFLLFLGAFLYPYILGSLINIFLLYRGLLNNIQSNTKNILSIIMLISLITILFLFFSYHLKNYFFFTRKSIWNQFSKVFSLFTRFTEIQISNWP